MGQYDIALRDVVRRHGKELAQVVVPAFPVESVTWAESQLVALERRMDRALDLRGEGRRQFLHVELAVRLRRRVAYRVYEYASLLVIAEEGTLLDRADDGVANDNDEELCDDDLDPRAAPPRPAAGSASQPEAELEEAAAAPVASVVIVLSGRKKPWPRRGRYRASAVGQRFSGHSFRIEAVYQRTVAELWARPGSFWLVFTPPAVDADAGAMRRVVEELVRREAPEERALLYTAMLLVAELDPWGHDLREDIKMAMREIDLKTMMEFATFREWYDEVLEKGGEKGVEKGVEKGRHEVLEGMLRTLLMQHLHRDLTTEEQAAISTRAGSLTVEQAVEVARQLHGEDLRAWLLGPDAE